MPTNPQPQQMAVSDFNLQKLSTKELAKHIEGSINTESNIAVFGRRGSGKTEISKQEIAKSGAIEVYLNLSVMERVDLGGYPNLMSGQTNRFVEFLMPAFYRHMIEGDRKVVLLLDEVDKADSSLWAPLLELTQYKSINGNKFKNLKSIIMTGNLISEGGSRPSLPLLDRAEKYLVTPDVSDWLEWAGTSNAIHPSVAAFINDNHSDLFGAVDPDERYADPSPRGWHLASNLLFKGEALGWNSELLAGKVAGCIGKEIAARYEAYYIHYQELLPMVAKIFEGENVVSEYRVLEESKKLVASMIVCSRLATMLDQADVSSPPDSLEHVGKFLQITPDEHVLVAVRAQLGVQRVVKFEIDEIPSWSSILSNIAESLEDV